MVGNWMDEIIMLSQINWRADIRKLIDYNPKTCVSGDTETGISGAGWPFLLGGWNVGGSSLWTGETLLPENQVISDWL